MHRILFVCMGNICRSPTAEGYFRHHLARTGLGDQFIVDSAGTHGYHVGNPPDPRAQETAAGRGVDLSALRARQVAAEDFRDFDLIIAMDRDNLRRLRELDPGDGAELALMLKYSPGSETPAEVPDPYYGGQAGFEHMCDLLDEATRGLLDHIVNAR
jgi:protein-tyrosine phosphatase